MDCIDQKSFLDCDGALYIFFETPLCFRFLCYLKTRKIWNRTSNDDNLDLRAKEGQYTYLILLVQSTYVFTSTPFAFNCQWNSEFCLCSVLMCNSVIKLSAFKKFVFKKIECRFLVCQFKSLVLRSVRKVAFFLNWWQHYVHFNTFFWIKMTVFIVEIKSFHVLFLYLLIFSFYFFLFF